MNSTPLHSPPSSTPLLLGLGALLLLCTLACGDDGGSSGNRPTMTNTTNTSTTNTTGTSATNTTTTQACLTNEDINGGKTLEEGEYCVKQALILTQGVLELKPGVVLKFDAATGLSVSGEGRLKALGTMEKPVVFSGTTAIRGHWRGITFSGSKSVDNQLDHVTIEYAGSSSSRGGLYIEGSGNSLKISNAMFKENDVAAIHIVDNSAECDIESTAFDKNQRPLIIPANLAGRLKPDLTFRENIEEFIWLTPEDRESAVSTPQTWQAFSAPYRASAILQVQAKLTLSPGVGMVFEQNVGLNVEGEGRLSAVGTMEQPITFTGLERTRGFWRGIQFVGTKSSDNILEHVVVEFGGSTTWRIGVSDERGGVLVRDAGSALKVANSRFFENAFAAIQATQEGSTLEVTNTEFESNELPLWVSPNLVRGLGTGLTFASNEKPYILVSRNSNSVVTKSLWLDHPAPYRVAEDIAVTAELTIEPGTMLVFEQAVGISINGGILIADAKGADPISFVAADPGALGGYWKGIRFSASFESANVLANVDVNNAGAATWTPGRNSEWAAILLHGKSQVKLDDVRIDTSGRYGLSAGTGSVFNVVGDNVTFNGIAGDGDATTNDEKYGDGTFSGI